MGFLHWWRRRETAQPVAIGELIDRLTHGDDATRLETVRELDRRGPDAADAADALEAALDDPNKEVQLEAADALVRVGGDVARAMDALTRLLQDDEARIRVQAARQIGRSGDRAEPAVPALVHALGDPDDSVVHAGVDALLQTGPAAVPQLIHALQHGEPRVRRGAADAVVKIAPVAIPTFVEMTDSKDRSVRLIAALSLADLIPAEETLALVLEALTHEEALFRAWAARTLGLFGPEVVARAGIPLEHAQKDTDPEVRAAADRALARVRGDLAL